MDITIHNGVTELGIFEKGKDAWVSTRIVAEMFEKDHAHILRDIRDKILPFISKEFNESNFGLVYYRDKKGENRPEYLLNRKSFSLVVMGFTGEKAMHFKECYVNAFESMANLIATRILSKEGNRLMTDAIKEKMPSDKWAYSRENDMVNRVVHGLKAKDFREIHGIEEDVAIRDTVVVKVVDKIDKALRLNAMLIRGGLDYYPRKAIIECNFGDPTKE